MEVVSRDTSHITHRTSNTAHGLRKAAPLQEIKAPSAMFLLVVFLRGQGSTDLGCFQDRKSDRVFRVEHDSDDMTPEVRSQR